MISIASGHFGDFKGAHKGIFSLVRGYILGMQSGALNGEGVWRPKASDEKKAIVKSAVFAGRKIVSIDDVVLPLLMPRQGSALEITAQGFSHSYAQGEARVPRSIERGTSLAVLPHYLFFSPKPVPSPEGHQWYVPLPSPIRYVRSSTITHDASQEEFFYSAESKVQYDSSEKPYAAQVRGVRSSFGLIFPHLPLSRHNADKSNANPSAAYKIATLARYNSSERMFLPDTMKAVTSVQQAPRQEYRSPEQKEISFESKNEEIKEILLPNPFPAIIAPIPVKAEVQKKLTLDDAVKPMPHALIQDKPVTIPALISSLENVARAAVIATTLIASSVSLLPSASAAPLVQVPTYALQKDDQKIIAPPLAQTIPLPKHIAVSLPKTIIENKETAKIESPYQQATPLPHPTMRPVVEKPVPSLNYSLLPQHVAPKEYSTARKQEILYRLSQPKLKAGYADLENKVVYIQNTAARKEAIKERLSRSSSAPGFSLFEQKVAEIQKASSIDALLQPSYAIDVALGQRLERMAVDMENNYGCTVHAVVHDLLNQYRWERKPKEKVHPASVSKLAIVYAAIQLALEGKIDLDARVEEKEYEMLRPLNYNKFGSMTLWGMMRESMSDENKNSNYISNILLTILGSKTANEILKKNGFGDTFFANDHPYLPAEKELNGRVFGVEDRGGYQRNQTSGDDMVRMLAEMVNPAKWGAYAKKVEEVIEFSKKMGYILDPDNPDRQVRGKHGQDERNQAMLLHRKGIDGNGKAYEHIIFLGASGAKERMVGMDYLHSTPFGSAAVRDFVNLWRLYDRGAGKMFVPGR